jgi:hypothetical protein
MQHFALRGVLSSFGLAPLRYARFLNHATERTLLQRIGGRCRFIHDLLRITLRPCNPRNRSATPMRRDKTVASRHP